ncbi:MAG: DUF2157 domain-containing protein [Saprospiraceae bacterium]
MTEYYPQRVTPQDERSTNLLTIVFSILGALLVGMGIILIIAHNWDNLSLTPKTLLAFAPLITGQAIAGYSLLHKKEQANWREGSATFLFFAVAACIALISQIYNLEGELAGFLLMWMLLCFPIAYLLRSSMASLLFFIGTTWLGTQVGYDYSPAVAKWWYWVLLLLGLPYYYWLYKRAPHSNFFNYHSAIIAVSIAIMLGSFESAHEDWYGVAYVALAGVYYLIGRSDFFAQKRVLANPFLILGSLGIVIPFLVGTFRDLWEEIWSRTDTESLFSAPTFWISVLLLGGVLALFWYNTKRSTSKEIPYIGLAPFVFLILFLLGSRMPILSAIIANICVLGLGIITTLRGVERDHLGILNYGLLIITALIICRFFDTDISFVIRGLLFVAVGIGFFMVNSWALKQRKSA